MQLSPRIGLGKSRNSGFPRAINCHTNSTGVIPSRRLRMMLFTVWQPRTTSVAIPRLRRNLWSRQGECPRVYKTLGSARSRCRRIYQPDCDSRTAFSPPGRCLIVRDTCRNDGLSMTQSLGPRVYLDRCHFGENREMMQQKNKDFSLFIIIY